MPTPENTKPELTREESREMVKGRFTYEVARERLRLIEENGPKDKPCSVYMMTSPSSQSYIGYTTQPVSLRIYDHMLDTFKKRTHIVSALCKYPSLDTQWEFSVLHWARNAEEAAELEKKAIAEHDTYEHGYNNTPGGEIPLKDDTVSERNRRSVVYKQQQRYKLNHCLFENAEKNHKEPPK